MIGLADMKKMLIRRGARLQAEGKHFQHIFEIR
jgi:hypothetical protein